MEQVLYKLPYGWEWQAIEDVAQIGADRGFVPTPDSEGNVPFIGMTDIDQETGQKSTYELRKFDDVKKGYTKFQRNAVLFAKITPCTENNKTALIDNVNCGFATTEVFPIHALDSVEPKYLLHFFRSPSVRSFLIDQMEGATGRQRVPLKALKNVSVPVCGLREQKRIVEKLDALLTRIDTAIKHLQESVTLADTLMKNGLSEIFESVKDRYEVVPLSSVVKINSGIALPKLFKNGFSDGDIPFFKVAQMNNHYENMVEPEITFNETVAKEHKIKLFPKGSTLIPKRGGAILTNKKRMLLEDASYDSNIMGLKADESKISDEYLFAFMRTIDLANFVDASTIPQVNNKHIDQMQIPLASIEEQADVVDRVNLLVKKVELMNSEIQIQLDDLHVLKNSILDSAFKGEL
ncbi:restriction endonuclease subunit S [Vibrio parahaemolyticus]|uniref:restriction endonuclease subunit S n=1 Tax=Vibrio parahaemolyticus TaxID=670 RepID=UPI00287AE485|nr:restriction endonuclease subunit S [Vibrio parahaemolyticus]MDS1791501.1 restriction endonuclease subunit S [Vibrio parahaemolyticus]